ncbi:hypothetical protein ES703_110780 [subsurface metagenome]
MAETSVSGNVVVTSVSGNIVYVSGQPVKVSGQTVVTSVSGNVVKISGQTVVAETSVPTMVKTGPIRTLSDDSGGVILHSGAVKAALLKALSDNSGIILVGGSGDRPWYEADRSGQGMVLAAGEAQSKDISNFDQIYVVAQVSGDRVVFEGVN